MNINLKGDLLSFKTPVVMGVLNFTDDSFYDGGIYTNDTAILLRVEQILCEGGQIVDIGAISTRPNAIPTDAGTEYQKIKKCINLIIRYFPNAKLSVDTFRANVAQMALGEGAAMINDISGGEDNSMFKVIGQSKVPYCLTFNMRNNNFSDNELIPEMLSFFANKIELLKEVGVNDILLDPGFGFGQSLDQNYLLMNNLDIFKQFNLPLLVGISRKSMIYNLLNSTPQDALFGTIALNTIALTKGANIIRVHDVKAAVDTIKITEKIMNS